MIAFEYLKDFAEETVSEKHSAGLDLDCGDVVLGCDGLDGARVEIVVDRGSRGVRFHSIEKPYRNVGVFCRKNAGRMKDLCSEITELGGLVKVEVAHRRSAFDHARVIVVHTVNVCPNLDFACLYGCSYQGCSVV